MNHHWRILRATLRAAQWKRSIVSDSVPISVPLIWAIGAAAAELVHQYFEAADSAFYSAYGLNSTVAGLAVVSSVIALLAPNQKAFAVSVVLALDTAWFVLAAATSALLRMVPAETVSLAFWTRLDTLILQTLLILIWWVGAVAAIFRSVDPYRGTVARAAAACLMSVGALALLPNLPMFAEKGFDYRDSNLWEWSRSKFFDRAEAEEPKQPKVDLAKLELSQAALLDGYVKKLLPDRKGAADIYAIGVAGWSDQDVFIKELDGGLSSLDKAIAIDRGAIRLVNHLETIERTPLASRSNFASAVHYVAGIMNRDEDVLLIFITSHGSPTGVGLYLADAMWATLTPEDIASVLEREGIKNRIVIVSACYAGIFVKPLATPDSIVITAADENNPSFGCSNEREWTYFGDAFFNHGLRPGVSLEEAFADAKVTISQWEVRDSVPASNPQAYFGTSLSAKLASRSNGVPHLPQPGDAENRRVSATGAELR